MKRTLLVTGMFIVLLISCNRNKREIIAEGIFDRVEYKMTGLGGADWTIIYFTDGRVCPIDLVITITKPKGSYIKVIKEGFSMHIE
jgi:hypothetical protein